MEVMIIILIGIMVSVILIIYRNSETPKTHHNNKPQSGAEIHPKKIPNPLQKNESPKKTEEYPEVRVESHIKKFKPIRPSKNGGWIINPDASFELTLNASYDLASHIRDILDDDRFDSFAKADMLTAILSEHNITCSEVELYKQKYRGIYLSKLEELKHNSTDWQNAFDLDRKDILDGFREIALSLVYEKAECDLVSLFECEPSDFLIDDELIKEYGFENIKLYVRYADKMDKIHVISSNHYNRSRFEKLVELKLAERGHSISRTEVLGLLTLKELNALAGNPVKSFRRKKEAINFIEGMPNIDKEIGKLVALRELFRLLPLPEKYSSIDLDSLAESWSYTYNVASLLVSTFRNSFYCYERLSASKAVTAFQVERTSFHDCPRSLEMDMRIFPRTEAPNVPFHIGCKCSISPIYDDEINITQRGTL